MSDETAQLLVKVAATTELLKVQMAAAAQSVDRFEKRTNVSLGKIDSQFSRLQAGATKMGAVLAGGVAGAVAAFTSRVLELPGALIEITKRGLEYAGSLGETADKLGVSTKFMQEFRFAAEQNGASIEGADKALGKFSVTLGKAFDGQKGAVDAVNAALKGTGVTLADLAKQSDSERYSSIAEGISKIGDASQQSSRAQAIFGKGYADILPLLKLGAAGFNDAAREAAHYGLVLSDGQIANADRTADKIQALNRALEAKIAGVVADNANAIGQLANELATLASWAVQAGTRFLGFINIVKSRGFAGALLATTAAGNGARLEYAATPKGAREESARAMIAAKGELDRLGNTARRYGARVDPATQAAAQQKFDQTRSEYRAARGLEVLANTPDRANARVGGNDATVTPVAGSKKRGGKKTAPVDRFEEDLARAQVEELHAQLDIATEAGERARIQRLILQASQAEQDARIDENKNLSAAQKTEIKAKYASAFASQSIAIDREQQAAEDKESLERRLAINDNEIRLLEGAAGLARTASERKAIQLQIIEKQIQAEGAELDAILASGASANDKAKARDRLNNLQSEKSLAQQQVARDNQSPIEAYRDTVHRSADQMREDLERVQVDGLQGLNDGITEAIVNGKSLGSVFKSVANQIIADLIRIAIQQTLIKPLLGGSGGGILSFLSKAAPAIAGRALGGPIDGLTWVGERGPELVAPRMSGNVLANSALRGLGGGGGMRVEIVDTTGLFETRVTQISAPLAARAGQAATLQGADLAGARAAVRSSRQLA